MRRTGTRTPSKVFIKTQIRPLVAPTPSPMINPMRGLKLHIRSLSR